MEKAKDLKQEIGILEQRISELEDRLGKSDYNGVVRFQDKKLENIMLKEMKKHKLIPENQFYITRDEAKKI